MYQQLCQYLFQFQKYTYTSTNLVCTKFETSTTVQPTYH